MECANTTLVTRKGFEPMQTKSIRLFNVTSLMIIQMTSVIRFQPIRLSQKAKFPSSYFFSAQTRSNDYVQTTETSSRLEDYINTLPNEEGEHLIVKVKINTM